MSLLSASAPTAPLALPLPHLSRKRTYTDLTGPAPSTPKRTCVTFERPSWVLERTHSTRVSTRIDASAPVDVLLPSGEVLQQRPVGELIAGEFTVLVFLGFDGEMTLRAVAAVKGLLGGMGAKVFAVSAGAEGQGMGHGQGQGRGVPVVFDAQSMLTKRLGLLHPLGGGRVALDAVVVLDAEGRARMVLPIGWGARGCCDNMANRWENVVGRLVRGVEWLRGEGVEGEVEMTM